MGQNQLTQIKSTSDLTLIQRKVMQRKQCAGADLLAIRCLLEKAADTPDLPDEARMLIEAANYQVQQISEQVDHVINIIDNLVLELPNYSTKE